MVMTTMVIIIPTAAAVSSKGKPHGRRGMPGAITRAMPAREGVGAWERVRASGQLFGILRTIMPRIGHNTDT
jgi:hypothetical protein